MRANSDENHWNWRGDKAGYAALHMWVARRLGKAHVCVDCGAEGDCQWANISGTYKRDTADYKSLCRTCHQKFDRPRWGQAKQYFSKQVAV